MRLSERAARDLGWDEFLRHLAGLCQSEPGRSDCLSLPFMDDPGTIAAELQAVKEAQDVLARREKPSFGDVSDITPDLDRAEKGGTLPAASLLSIARTASASNLVRGFIVRRREHYPAMSARHGALERVENLAEEIRRVLDEQGQVKDSASPLLGEFRAQLLRLREEIVGRIKEMMAQPLFFDMLQDGYYTIRNGRYVLPVKVNFKNQVKGIIHGTSQTGATLFIEPDPLIEPGNEIMVCESRIEDEIERLLSSLSRAAARESGVLRANLETLRRLDVLFAKAEIASLLNASAPAAGPSICLLGAHHPLLSIRQKEVVANDITIPEACRGLLVSGPNAGGKTVLLKTVGLAAAMFAAGVPPAVLPGSTIPLFDEVFAVFGDAQDLRDDLSSFSGHLVQLNAILDRAGPRSLVLLDEIASDTDPREGAALAAAIIEELSARGALVLATTHFHELREWVSGQGGTGHRRVINAAVGFDLLRMRPSFKLQIGAAGESFALKIALNFGFPARIIERARSFLGAAYVEAERLLGSLKQREAELDARIAAADAGAARRTREMEETQKAAEAELAEKRRELEAERERLFKEIGSLRDRAAAEISRIQRGSDTKAAVDVQKWLGEVMKSVERARDREKPARAASPGDRVQIASLNIAGTVERIDYQKREAVVAAQGKRVTVPLCSLALAPAPAPSAGQPSGRALLDAISKAGGADGPAGEVDVRGLFADEAVAEMDIFLDRSYREDAAQVRIIHGLGTGALQRAVREHLKASPYVASFRPGTQKEGGDGVTVVVLKNG
ncbi:MAG: Smr/MutS family protein [Deltaproteobacteria bacterium]|nr:Smr/MutS family protein [Deltaproteobacteria bacterium]